MLFTSKRTVVILTAVFGLLLSVLSYFGYKYYCDNLIKSVAVKYLNLLDVSTKDNLESNIMDIGTEDFIERYTPSIKNAFNTHKKINASVDKILLVDRRKAALEAVVYYTTHPEGKDYSSPAQLNLVLYKEKSGWKVQDAYFMDRSDQPIPENSNVERANQIKRYSIFLSCVNQFLESRKNGNLEQYLSLFAETVDRIKYSKHFSDEQEYLAKNNLTISFVSNGLLVNSSSDLEGFATLLLTQIMGEKSISIPMKFKFVYEEGDWKISEIIS